ncbi:MAG: hypothetical protein LBG11_06225 [Bifidobacteriaceae bacterium]|nr:hypothetical protein [Bifidobacteriaceae bacterium]
MRLAAAAATIGARLDRVSARRSATSSGGQFAGEPKAKGGSGAYCVLSWERAAVDGPETSATKAKAMSMPADTPDEVLTAPSLTQR